MSSKAFVSVDSLASRRHLLNTVLNDGGVPAHRGQNVGGEELQNSRGLQRHGDTPRR